MKIKELIDCIGERQAVEVRDTANKKLGYFLDAKDIPSRLHKREVDKIWIIDDGDWSYKFVIQVKEEKK